MDIDDWFALGEGDDMATIEIPKSSAHDDRAERLLRDPAQYFIDAMERAKAEVRSEIDRRAQLPQRTSGRS